MDAQIRHYVVLKSTPNLWEKYQDGDLSAVEKYISDNLHDRDLVPKFEVVALASNQVGPLGAERAGFAEQPDQLVVGLTLVSSEAAEQFQKSVRQQRDDVFVGSGADLPFLGSDHWCPSEARDPIFGTRAEAERLLGVPYIRDTKKLRGANVNVVIVDQGLDKDALGPHYGSGWPVHTTMPGSTKPPAGSMHRTHGMMIAHNVLQVAPDATLFDLPMVPPRIIDVEGFFLHTADAAFRTMLGSIVQLRRKRAKWSGPWIIVNAWAIFDRSDEHPKGSYTNDPNHPFSKLVAKAVDAGVDVVFCAGNCGQFCPDMRCGGLDQGPGQSIFGANCHPKVLSVGAVRTDTMWLGYSSQGPGQPGFGPLAREKPDLCAPSQFCETEDAFTTNGGTSAASGLAAGVIAALRSNAKWNQAAVPPERLKEILNGTARKTGSPGWNNRLGNGILDAKAAVQQLP